MKFFFQVLVLCSFITSTHLRCAGMGAGLNSLLITIIKEEKDQGRVAEVQRLLDWKADPNTNHQQPLHEAVARDCVGTINLLLHHRIQFDSPKFGTALCALNDARRLKKSQAASVLAAQHQLSYDITKPDQVDSLLGKKACINACDKGYESPLHRAIRRRASPALVKQLLESKANPIWQYGDNLTPFEYTLRAKDLIKLTEVFLEHNPQLSRTCVGNRYPLYTTLRYNNDDGTALLLKARASAIGYAGEDTTPLHVAVHHKVPPFIVGLLVEHKANPSMQDSNGYTPFQYAQGEDQMAKYWAVLPDASAEEDPGGEQIQEVEKV